MRNYMRALQRVSFSTLIALSVAGAPAPGFAQTQQNFPSKPICLIVPFSAGSGVDINARLVALKLNESWGQPVVIENRTGGGGRLGAAIVAKAQPDDTPHSAFIPEALTTTAQRSVSLLINA